MSTDTGRAAASPAIDANGRYRLNPSVALRPESFGALAYHFGNRRLSFLKEPMLADVVRGLADHESVAATLAACGIPAERTEHYLRALASLVAADMIVAA